MYRQVQHSALGATALACVVDVSAAKYEVATVIILENFHNKSKFSGKFIKIVKSFLKKKKIHDKLSYLESFMLIVSHLCTKLTVR